MEKKEQKPKKDKGKPEEKKPKKLEEGVQGIIRFAESDLEGTKKLHASLLKVKGVGHSLAYSICRKANIDPDMTTGRLTEDQVRRMEEVLENLQGAEVPGFMLNRRTDPETGKNRHLTGSELTLRRKFDIDFLRKIRCYKGIRHEQGLPVRGQRTRGSFRTGARVGVQKKALKEKKKG